MTLAHAGYFVGGGGVSPIKGPLSSDLKSRDNVYITTAGESAMRSRVGRFFGCVLCGVTIVRNKEVHSYIFWELLLFLVNQQTPYTNENEETKKREHTKTLKQEKTLRREDRQRSKRKRREERRELPGGGDVGCRYHCGNNLFFFCSCVACLFYYRTTVVSRVCKGITIITPIII